MNKKKRLILFFTFALLFVFGFGCFKVLKKDKANADVQSDFYWSESNEPVFYGAIGAKISKNVVFDTSDPRFRIFARDFEDGDLGVTIEENTVTNGVPGTYKVIYSATDSHKNRTELEVKVEITNDDDGALDVTRRIHTIPNDWNMAQLNFSRNNNGDREILGIFMPASSSFEFKALSENWTAKLSLFNTHRDQENYTINVPYSDDDAFTTIQLQGNTDGLPHDCIPFITSTKLKRGEDIQTTYDYEIKYNQTEIKVLDYYYYGDNEEEFLEKFKSGTNSLGVFEGQEIVVLFPKKDVNNIQYFHDYTCLNDVLDYFGKVVRKMDEIAGLKMRPEKATDQNFRAKQFFKEDTGTGAGAYYNGGDGFVGLRAFYAIFQMNWGGLHEIAHGYQGIMGGGTLGLNETSNNFFALYIQRNKEIYTSPNLLSEMVNLENVEDKYMKIINDNGSLTKTDVSTRLYAMINLLDSFEGEKTYAKLFSYVREKVDDGTIKIGDPQQDFYSLFFADIYKTNILPFWDEIGVSISYDVQKAVMERAEKHYSILHNSVNDEEKLEEVLAGENEKLKYKLVSDEVLEKYGIKSSLKLNLNISDPSDLSGKKVLLEKNGKAIYQAEIKNSKVNFEDINSGTYIIRFPILKNYSIGFEYAYLKAGESELTFDYTEKDNATYTPLKIIIAGVAGTNGYTLTFSKNNTHAHLLLWPSNMGNQSDAWKKETDRTFISATIESPSGEIVDERIIKGGEFFTLTANTNLDFDIEIGTKIKIFTELPGNVGVWLVNTNERLTEYNDTAKNFTFLVTKNGIMPEYKSHFNMSDVLYEHQRDYFLQNMEEIKEYFDGKDGVLDAKYFSVDEKDKYIECYEKLQEEDRQEYTDLYNKILAGGKPQITVLKSEITVNQGEDIDFYSCFSET